MRWTFVLLTTLVSSACSTAAPTTERRDPRLLYPIDDESKLERQIGRYLKGQKNLKLQYVEQDGDVWVILNFDIQGVAFSVGIDTENSSEDRSERRIRLVLDTDYEIDASRYGEVMRAIDRHHRAVWAGTFFVTPEDNEVTGRWSLNLPGRPLDPEFVHDALVRLSASWMQLQRRIAETTTTL